MALYPDLALPPPLTQALRALIDAIPARDLVLLCRRHATLFKGFQIKPEAAKRLRKRLEQIVTGKALIPDTLRESLAEFSFNGDWVTVLSEAALAHGFDVFGSLFGFERLILGMLLDPREAVQAMGAVQVTSDPPFKPLPAAEAAAALRDRFGPMIDVLGEGLGAPASAAPSATPSDHSAETARLREELELLRPRAGKLRAVERRLERTEQQRETLTTRIRELEIERTRIEAERDEATRRAERADTTIAALADQRDKDVSTAVAEALTDRALRWLTRAEAVERAVDDGADRELLQRADDALAHQAAVDHHSGNRAMLEKRLAALHSALQRVRTAQTHALTPLGELDEVKQALHTECRRLEALLGAEADTPVVAELESRIAQADMAALETLRGLTDQLQETRLIFSAQHARLLDRLRDRQAILLAADGRDLPRRNPAAAPGRLEALLSGCLDGHLLIDGHNVILCAPARYARHYGPDGVPGKTAREALLNDLRQIADAAPGLRIRCYFDGPTFGQRDVAPNLQEIFSGGTGDNRADRAIVDYVTFLDQPPRPPCALVTDDLDLARQARELHAMTPDVAQFLSWLSRPF